MKRENFVSMMLGSIGIILFGIGMCMCLLPKWNAFQQGIIVGSIGAFVLLAMIFVRRKMQHKPAITLSAKGVAAVAVGMLGVLMLGVGMCMAMVWTHLMIPGIVVGCVGILVLLSLIPLCKGLQ